MFNSFGEFFDRLEKDYGGLLAVEFCSEDSIIRKTYAELSADVRRSAEFIRSRCGDESGRHVALIGEDIYDLMVCLYGSMTAGEIAIPLNPRETEQIIDYSLELVDADIILVDEAFERRNPGIAEKYRDRTVLMKEYAQLEQMSGKHIYVDGDECIIMLMTSGTTGAPKAVMLSLNNLFSPIESYVSSCLEEAETVRTEKQPTVFSIMMLYHISGLATTMTFMSMGFAIAMCTDMKYMYRDIATFKPEVAITVPTIIEAWIREIRHGHRDRLGTIRVISTGAASVSSGIAEMLRSVGIMINQGYGMTEVCGGVAINKGFDTSRATAAGLPAAGCDIRIEDGEVTVSGPGVAKGYYKNPEATAEVFRNGRVYTGDLGYFDEKGYLYITGRKKSIIILSSGENVNPEELEQLIAGCSQVRDVLVCGKNGRICARLLVQEEDRETVEAYIRELNRTLPTYKRITMFEYVDEPFERTASGKLKRINQG